MDELLETEGGKGLFNLGLTESSTEVAALSQGLRDKVHWIKAGEREPRAEA